MSRQKKKKRTPVAPAWASRASASACEQLPGAGAAGTTHWLGRKHKLNIKQATSSFLLLVVWPGATSSILVASSDALVTSSFENQANRS